MLETALEAVKVLKAEERQVVIVEHLDEPHPHVHITINMIHPETGMSTAWKKIPPLQGRRTPPAILPRL